MRFSLTLSHFALFLILLIEKTYYIYIVFDEDVLLSSLGYKDRKGFCVAVL